MTGEQLYALYVKHHADLLNCECASWEELPGGDWAVWNAMAADIANGTLTR